MAVRYFEYRDIFRLESGGYLPGFTLAYTIHGKLNAARNNVIWIIHALTANADPTEWWPGIVGPGCPIDTNRYFVICANCPGSHYGSTGPLSINPEVDEPYFHDFPFLTIRDIVKSYDLLRLHLGIDRIHMLTGASMGGQQALEWSILQNGIFDHLLLIATNARHSPWGIAFNESQRMAIESDQSWDNRHPEAGLKGMKTARSVALLSYRTSSGYNRTQQDDDAATNAFRAASYQRYQGDKLANRFNAFSYYILTRAMDSHNIGRGRGGIDAALRLISANTTIIGIRSDLLFPPEEQEYLAKHIHDSFLEIIDSDLGHDGFLTESEKVGNIITGVLNQEKRTRTIRPGLWRTAVL